MNKVRSEPVHVQAKGDDGPVRFVWQDRLYTVRAVLEHWVIGREWWQDPEAGRGQADEFWRVEAAPGPGMTAAVYELRREPTTGAWSLRRDTG